jgi:hypothetical protein
VQTMADLIKIEDELDTVENLLQAAFLASSGLGDDMNAMASLIAVIQKELTCARVTIRGEIGAEATQPTERHREVLSFIEGVAPSRKLSVVNRR